MQQGHGKTSIPKEEIGVIAAWIDLNVPFVGAYDERHTWPADLEKFYHKKGTMRVQQEAIEAENIRAFIQAGQ